MPDTDLSQAIQDAASNPMIVETDGTKVQSKPISELIEADKYLAQKNAAKGKYRGLRFSKIVPPGAV